MEMKRTNRHRAFLGHQEFYSHPSQVCGGEMKFSIYLPEAAAAGKKLPVLYWLSGLTCTEENFTVKAGAQRWASQFGVIVVACDTSPRGAAVPGEDASYDLGTGAGFFLNATQAPWSKCYRMEDYVVSELPAIVEKNFPADPARRAISGHSMGGHGALTLYLKHPGFYQSASAFSPICAPSQCPWGEKAFTAYLGSDRTTWAQHDANELVKAAKLPSDPRVLVDQGLSDQYLENQLKLDLFEATCRAAKFPLTVRRREGYDHSYYYISTFLEEHFRHHFG